MPTIEHVRKELKPTFLHYTDAVLSMIGTRFPQVALEAAKKGDLSEAEAALFYHSGYPADCRPRCKNDHMQFIDDKSKKPPQWLEKDFKPVPRKVPEITIEDKWDVFGRLLKIKIGKNVVGTSRIKYRKRNGKKILIVEYLQQQTKGYKPRQARRFEGWKNAFMRAIEEKARKKNVRAVWFSTGRYHVIRNVFYKLIHQEILETYGRLPMQHGYKLVEHKRRFKNTHLWWEKALN